MPELLDDYVADTNPVQVVDFFVDELDIRQLGFEGVESAETGSPAYDPAILLKICIYGYLNRTNPADAWNEKRNVMLS